MDGNLYYITTGEVTRIINQVNLKNLLVIPEPMAMREFIGYCYLSSTTG
ncbi:Protein of unknown function [Pyronema omphalodes CBS 100304]|uniref:Uncharacterized protein n=1 Tax=Pyronema omphalodes (strain CBS 100304) TaxID=1076935 RepID=U4LS91_PYROM|nr:Protein of unknown function [Pyronema omphalodes CBS 100304]